jgi:hypothetical protein
VAEIEIKKEVEYTEDYLARRVGVLAALIAVVLAVVTIASHRSHTDAVLAKAESSDQWAFYQAKSLKRNNAALGAEIAALGAGTQDKTAAVVQKFRAEAERYDAEAKPIQEKAEAAQQECERQEHRALRFDIGEGLLELGLVLCSLYFISRRRIFPTAGIISAGAGAISGVLGFLS